jgi:hypothetical protein
MNGEEQQAWLDAMANKKLAWKSKQGWLVPDPKSLTMSGQFRHRACSKGCTIDGGSGTHGSIGCMGEDNWHIVGEYTEDIIAIDDILPVLTY